MINTGVEGLQDADRDICVVGAGPVGISLALELARLGLSVLLLESGTTGPTAAAQRLADAHITVPKYHVPMDIAVQRSLGGTSNLWGGRCVPMDAMDFEPRPAVPGGAWPITFADVEPYFASACTYLGCGPPEFELPIDDLRIDDPDFRFSCLERWSQQPRLGKTYAGRLRAEPNIDLRLTATMVGLTFLPDGRVDTILVRDAAGGAASIRVRRIVLAAGGLENTRLLLAARQDAPNRFGGENGPLGRYYMGHLYGSSAEMVIAPALDRGIDYFRDRHGYYVRRRFTPSPELQRRAGLSNVSLWPDYPVIYDPRHRDGILSFAYLALSVPWIGRRIVVESIRRNYLGPDPVRRLPHIGNVLRAAPSTAMFIPSFLYHRYLTRPRMPGFFQRNAARRYAVRFHAEHLPDPESRAVLTQERDALGLPRLSIDLRYTEADAEPLIRAHDCFAHWLARTGLGTMEWTVPPERRAAHIIEQ